VAARSQPATLAAYLSQIAFALSSITTSIFERWSSLRKYCWRAQLWLIARSQLKILILKPSALGDVVQALPVLRLVKGHFPQSECHWWLAADLLPLLEDDSDLTGIFPFERRRWASPRHWPELLGSITQMRKLRFDWVIDLQGLARSGAFAWLANGHLTVGIEDPREGAAGFYDSALRRPSYYTHAVDWYLGVLPMLGIPVHRDFIWLPPRPRAAARIRDRWNPDSKRWLGISPGARWNNKCWPADYYAELVRQLAARYPEFNFAILGGKTDTPLGETIAAANPERCLDLTGKTSIPEMIEWIRLCELIVTNDTGPMHVAAALEKPIVALFGPTEPRRTGPYGQIAGVLQISLPCIPCLKPTCSYVKPFECLRAIRPAAVLREVERRLAREFPQPQRA
jgi:heptosyltransferase-1